MTCGNWILTNQSVIISQVIDDEAIIVNIETGVYYSLREPGATAWRLMEQGVTVESIIKELTQKYNGSLTDITSGVQLLLDELESENLITRTQSPVQDDVVSPTSSEFTASQKQPFCMPVLEKFDDMAQLLLLDPVHEVNEEGWPHARFSSNNDD